MAKKQSSATKAAALKAKQAPSLLSVDPIVNPVFAQGGVRSYLVTEPAPSLLKKRSLLGSIEWFLIAVLLVSSYYVRMFNLSYPKSVVFDEVHFGGFARKYILGKYFMDVHPPLAKMLFAAVASYGGFKGDFEFKSIGDYFPEGTPYVLMRQFPALLGMGTVLLAYFTLRSSGVRPAIAFATSFLLLVENSNVTISRYILLDSPLLFFIAASVFAWKKFEIQTPFSTGWFKSLFATGIALGLALSSKWVGLFTLAWVGLSCVYQMWFIVGDLSVSAKKVVAHAFFRGSILLGVPALLYLFFFAIHFQVLSKEGDGSAFMSSAFRAGLEGNTIPKNITAQVGLGSTVTIRHIDTQGGYLHSHEHYYPAGSKQQQITLYPHLDSNNKWYIEPYSNLTVYNETFVPLTDGMKVRLKHINTGKRLHSHDEKPPVSEREWQKEASCYGFEGFAGDANDDWVVEIVSHKTPEGEARNNVIALTSVIRFRHAMSGHYLFSSEVKLPEWGFGQQEVSAASSGRRALTHWYIETNENPMLSQHDARIINYPKLTLLQKFTESHKRMWKINQGLTGHHNWQSEPQEWPLMMRGINYWVREHRQVYLIGNAVTWWTVSSVIAVFFLYTAIQAIRWHTGSSIATDKNVYNFNFQVFSYILGWALHYLPFFIMGRQLFLHHYLPALYFGILALGHFLELFTGYFLARSQFLQTFGLSLVTVFVALSAVFYINYSPLIYATNWTKDQCNRSKAISTWDFDCNTFHGNISEYSIDEAASLTSASKIVDDLLKKVEEAHETPGELLQQKKPVDPLEEQKHLSQDGEKKSVESPQDDENLPVVEDVVVEDIVLEEAVLVEESVAPPIPDEETPFTEAQIPEEVESSQDATPVQEVAEGVAEPVQQVLKVEEPVVEELVAEEPAEAVEEAAKEVIELSVL